MRTPISYYGGKQAMTSIIIPMIPEHRVYTEVFFGGGAVFFAKQPSHNETINDRLDVVVNFYQILKTRYRELKPLIDASLISRTTHQMGLQIIRKHKKGKQQDPVKLAWAFWQCTNFAYRNKIGGGYKYSNEMSTVVPDTLREKKHEFTMELAKRIEHAHIECGDFLPILRSRNVESAFHYLDPPYVGTDMGHYSGFKQEDQSRLLNWIANECTGKFLLSTNDNPEVRDMVEQKTYRVLEVDRFIQPSDKYTQNGGHKRQLLVWNYDTHKQQLQLF